MSQSRRSPPLPGTLCPPQTPSSSTGCSVLRARSTTRSTRSRSTTSSARRPSSLWRLFAASTLVADSRRGSTFSWRPGRALPTSTRFSRRWCTPPPILRSRRCASRAGAIRAKPAPLRARASPTRSSLCRR
eukprot:Amastigsp_a677061_24.p4 type:complete len:131 gc:universal Amastigsp_a677061_24:1749-2141(+)